MSRDAKGLDDSAIMSNTVVERGPRENFRLKYVLPLSGRTVTSEWVMEDKRREALFAWVATIRNETAADSETYEADRKAKALAERVAKAAVPCVVDATGAPLVLPATLPVPAAALPPSGNPDDYIVDQLKRALMRNAAAEEAVSNAAVEAHAAKANLAKWQTLHETLKSLNTSKESSS